MTTLPLQHHHRRQNNVYIYMFNFSSLYIQRQIFTLIVVIKHYYLFKENLLCIFTHIHILILAIGRVKFLIIRRYIMNK